MEFEKPITSSPYPGLRPFETEESDIFFGREKQTDELLVRLHKHRFLAVVGPSGCGKSSLVRAGMIAGLKTGFICEAGSKWRIGSLRPGEHPLGQLAAALLAAAPSGTEYPPDKAAILTEAALRRGPLSLIEVARELGLCQGTNLLILVDQFEELFRFRQKGDPNEADAFVALLLNTAARRDLPIYIVITMRSDFFGDCAVFRDLPEAINEGQYLTPRLTREQCATAICGPARVFGGDVDDSLVNQLLNDFGPDPDQLPVLQHALMRMWHQRSHISRDAGHPTRIVLTCDDYESIGGLQNALSRHADEVLAELSPDRQRIAQIVFRRLTERGVGRRDTRAPAGLQEIADIAGVPPEEVIFVIEAFRRSDRSFLTPREGPLDPSTLLDIGHESLIRQWHTLAQWVEEEGESAAVYTRLRDTARLWKKGNAALWGTPDLEVALAWRRDTKPTQEWALRYGTADEFNLAMEFLEASAKREHRLEEEARQAYLARIRRANQIAIGSAILTLLLIGGFLLDMYLRHWTYTAYFHSYEKVWGAPRGIGELSRFQLRHRPYAVKITRKGRLGPVLRVEMVDRKGNLTTKYLSIDNYLADDPDSRDEDPGTVSAEYTYDAQGRVMQETALDIRGNRVWALVYLPPTKKKGDVRTGYYVGRDGYPRVNERYSNHAVEIQYNAQGYEVVRRYKTRGEKPVRGPFNAFGRRLQYNDQGVEVEETSLGPDDQPFSDNFGNATWRITRTNALGEEEEVSYLSTVGKLTVIQDGYASKRERYDRYGNILEESYFDILGKPTHNKDGYHKVTWKVNALGDAVELRYWDASGSPVVAPSGCSGFDDEYDPFDNVTKVTCIGPDGKPTLNVDGYSIAVRKFDNNHNIIDEQYFDTQGRPVLSVNGYGRFSTYYDPKSNEQLWVAYFREDGTTPALTKDGYSRVTFEYDSLGHEVKRSYYGVDGKPTRIKDGYAVLTAQYDDFDNVVAGQVLDENGQPTIGGDFLVAGWKSRYDAGGRQIEIAYFDQKGSQMRSSDGVAGRRSIYDEKGNEVERTYIDVGGETTEATIVGGAAGWQAKYNDLGKEIERQFVDKAGHPATINTGYSRRDKDYDRLGNVTEYRYYDANGHLVMARGCAPDREGEDADSPNHAQCAREVLRYNDQNQITEESYFDPSGNLVLVSDGWARMVNQYDARGNLVERSYFGINRQPVLTRSGYHAVRWARDNRGNAIEVTYFSTDGKPVSLTDGYARLTRSYDRFGRLVEEVKYDIHGRQTVGDVGYARLTDRYDRFGNLAEEIKYDEQGKPTTGKDGFASMTKSYDRFGRVVEQSMFDVNGKPALGKDGAHSYVLHYNQYGEVVQIENLGLSGQPVVCDEGWYMYKKKYDERGQIVEASYFGSTGQPVRSKSKGYARVLVVRDEQGQITAKKYFDENGKPLVPTSPKKS